MIYFFPQGPANILSCLRAIALVTIVPIELEHTVAPFLRNLCRIPPSIPVPRFYFLSGLELVHLRRQKLTFFEHLFLVDCLIRDPLNEINNFFQLRVREI